MEIMKLAATRRTETGKGPARRLRQQARIPAVAYGKELPAQGLAVSPKDVLAVLQSEFGRNTVIELSVDGAEQATVLLNDFQYDPVTRELLHADFRQIQMDRPVEVEVPFTLTGRSKGVAGGGLLRHVFRRLPIRCLPSQIPARIEHDITELDVEQHVSAGELALPEGVVVLLPAEQTVVAVASVKEVAAAGEEAAAEVAPGEEKPAEEGEATKEADAKSEQ
jgi:large subunit ribosomal protein L25